MSRSRSKGDGAMYQRHDHASCPKATGGVRPEHRCRGRWVGAVDVTEGATRRRAVFYGATKAEVKAAVKTAQARVDIGAPAKDGQGSALCRRCQLDRDDTGG